MYFNYFSKNWENTLTEKMDNPNVIILLLMNIPWLYAMFIILDITLHKMLTLEEAG